MRAVGTSLKPGDGAATASVTAIAVTDAALQHNLLHYYCYIFYLIYFN